DMQAIADIGLTEVTRTHIATRGENLVLMRFGTAFSEQGATPFHSELFGVGEINADQRIVAIASFDLNDFDSAVARLEARYLAGEAAPYAHTWSVVSESYAAIRRRELPRTTPDCVIDDHRRATAFGPGDLTAYVRAGWDLEQHISPYIEAGHRLNDSGAVVTHTAHGGSREGFEAEWRGVTISMIQGDMVSRCEMFDEADLDAALAKFEQLCRPTPRLENAASQLAERFLAHFAAGEWEAM